jgi:hypothetical protein
MNDSKKVWVYDLEVFINFFSATFVERDNPENVRVFVIHESRNDTMNLYHFLKTETTGLIGFNNINFDYPLLHFFIHVMDMYVATKSSPDANRVVDIMYQEAIRIINAEYSEIPQRDTKIPQLDVYKIHHFDNKAKATSLKAVEIAIQYPNVQDLPFDEDHWVEEGDIPEILGYNLNDVLATREFYFLSEPLVQLRKNIGKKYGINILNHNDPKIGQELFGREIAKKKGWSYRYVRDMRTFRSTIELKDCILPTIKFNSKEFRLLHDMLYATTVQNTKNAFDMSVIYKGFKYDYGTGGIHGCIEPGVYESDDDHVIIDIDVASYYPNLAINNEFYPQHLGKDFVTVYKEIYDQRAEAKRTGDKVINSALKLVLNGVFGKSNDMYSLFYDPKYFLSITINGQLLLSMLAESIVDNLTIFEEDRQMLQINTDGITIKIARKHEEHLHMLCEEWERYTGLTLEYAKYKKMVIRDVNNYLAETFEGEAKPKGCFEIIPMQNGAIAYNKNWSMRVVPKALHAYYLKGIPINEFIKNHDNIYDFCIGFRARGDWEIMYTTIANGERTKQRQQRTIRYYMSKSGGALTKENKYDKRIISLEAGKSAMLFNQYVKKPMKEYNIDYSYYIAEANKIKNAVDDGQLKIF